MPTMGRGVTLTITVQIFKPDLCSGAAEGIRLSLSMHHPEHHLANFNNAIDYANVVLFSWLQQTSETR